MEQWTKAKTENKKNRKNYEKNENNNSNSSCAGGLREHAVVRANCRQAGHDHNLLDRSKTKQRQPVAYAPELRVLVPWTHVLHDCADQSDGPRHYQVYWSCLVEQCQPLQF